MINILILVSLAAFSLGSLGQIFRISGVNLYLFDVTILLAIFYFMIFLIKHRKFYINSQFLIFCLFSFFSFIVTLFQTYEYQVAEKLYIFSFWARLNVYFLFGYLVYNLIRYGYSSKDCLRKILEYNFYLITLLNIIQYFFVLDISFMEIYGFDPHTRRLTGFFLDPNFMGFYLILYLYLNENFVKNKYLSYLSLILIFLTDSRSAFLTLIVFLVFNFFRNSRNTLIYLLLTVLLFLFSNLGSRIEHLSASNDSSFARIDSWTNAIKIYNFSPYFGIGFNNYRSYLIGHNIVSPGSYFLNSSNYSDSSLLSVLSFSGFIGAIIFVIFYASYVKNLRNFGFLIFIFLNSFIINSLFFPPTAVLIFLILNLELD